MLSFEKEGCDRVKEKGKGSLNNVALYRKKRGLSQEEFGDALKITQQAVSSYERGITDPRVQEVIKILDTVEGVTFDEMFNTGKLSVYIYKKNEEELMKHIEKIIGSIPGRFTDYEKKALAVNYILEDYFKSKGEKE